MKDRLCNRLYFQRPMFETARIIGYAGISPGNFWKKANKLGLPHDKLIAALDELTVANRREGKDAKFELTPEARQLCWQLLGPPPEHPDFNRMGNKPDLDDSKPTHAERGKRRSNGGRSR